MKTKRTALAFILITAIIVTANAPKVHTQQYDPESDFFKYPPEIRKAIYTTNAVESLNYSLRKIIKNKLIFFNDDAIFKILYLAIRNASEKWTMPIRDWGRALNQFAIEF